MNRFRQRQAGRSTDAAIDARPARDEFDADIEALEARLAAADDTETMALLSGFMSPANHHLPAGLHATRLFTRRFAGIA